MACLITSHSWSILQNNNNNNYYYYYYYYTYQIQSYQLQHTTTTYYTLNPSVLNNTRIRGIA